MDVAFKASRYGKGGEDYINCPFNREQYYAFVQAVQDAEKVPTKDFERCIYFEGCMPIEEMAERGRETLAFGPMKPQGLIDPRTGRRPFAAVQLRQENRERTLYNLVGFQTKMTYGEQKRVLTLIPGLENAEFVRLGSLHRNTFIDSPRHLLPTLQWQGRGGILAGLNAARLVNGIDPVVPPDTTALGSLLSYITDRQRKQFQPMNVNFGLLPSLDAPARGRVKKELMARRALADLDAWAGALGIGPLSSRAPLSHSGL
jgi:methylenetetrahydrofolate--tRNA-(uracil-5-)-methyltransferase